MYMVVQLYIYITTLNGQARKWRAAAAAAYWDWARENMATRRVVLASSCQRPRRRSEVEFLK